MADITDSIYDYYFSLGYETKEQIDLALKYNPPTSVASLHSGTDSVDSLEIATTGGTERLGLEITYNALPADTTLFNRFQVDFNVLGLPSGLDFYNPDEIDISVKFQLAGTTTVLYVNAYYGTEYTRNLCATPDPTIDTSITPVDIGISNMYPPCPYGLSEQFQWHSIQFNTPAGDPVYLTMPVSGWHARFAPPAIGVWTYSFLISINGGATSEHLGPSTSFNVGPSSNPGYVGATNRNFIFTGTQDIFIPMGCLGISCGTAPVFNRSMYALCTHAIDQLAANKGNHLRVWCTFDALGIEYGGRPWTVGDYDYGQDRAFDLDGVIEYAEQNGVYVQLVLDERLYFRPGDPKWGYLWDVNPYTPFIDAAYTSIFASNPYAPYQQYAPGLFFTSPDCIKYYKRKLRYTLARWGYSTNVFAVEFMNEVTFSFFVGLFPPRDYDLLTWAGTHYPYVAGSSPLWQAPGYIQVASWVNEMVDYCKNECYQGNNHMFTISCPGSESNLPNYYLGSESPDAYDFVNLMNIDFYTFHFYDTTQFTDYRINFLANRAKWLYPTKPYIIGEYWLNGTGDDNAALVNSDYTVYTGSFATITPPLYNCADFHSALFASILSGCGGAIQPFEGDMAGSPWGGQLAYYKPLSAFLDGEDLDWDNCIAIRNNCYLNDFEINEAIMPVISNYQNNDLPAYLFNINITATGSYVFGHGRPSLVTQLIEVFALQYFQGVNRGKIIGWVKNSNNWWYNLPHQGDNETDDMGYPGYNPVAELQDDFYPIQDVEITINGVFNATYQIDFYSVYPDWPLVAGGPPAENGGIIASFTVASSCNTLTFTVPFTLDAIKDGNGPIAPDYGFKATPTDIGWGYGYLGMRPSGAYVNPAPASQQPFSVGDGGKLLAYASIVSDVLGLTICDLCIYTRGSTDEYTWAKTDLAGIDPDFRILSVSEIALGSNDNQIFYKGTDYMLHCAYPDGTGWGHVNFGEPLGGDIGCAGNGGRVFFRGLDQDLHFLFWNNLGGPWEWRHYNFTESVGAGFDQKPHPNTNFSANPDGSLLAYRTIDSGLAIIYEISPWVYSYNWVAVEVGDIVRVNNAGDVVFYTDYSGNLWAYFWNVTHWESMMINTASGPVNIQGLFDIEPEADINNAQVYFQGPDGFVQVAYVWDGQWVSGHILCMPEPTDRQCLGANLRSNPFNAFIRYNSGSVFYQGVMPIDGSWYYDNFRAYYYGKGDVDDN